MVLEDGFVDRGATPVDEGVGATGEVLVDDFGGEANEGIRTGAIGADVDTIIDDFIRISN